MYVGFDIGGTNARLQLFDAAFAPHAERKLRIRDLGGPAALAAAMSAMLVDACDDPGEVQAIGVGLAGQLSRDGEIVFNAPNLHWRDVAFASMLREALPAELGGAKVRVVNDLSGLLWGEYAHGAAKGADDVLAIFVGTGVGGAILSDSRLVDGAGGKAGEIGHAKVVPGGRRCGCGEYGCVEAYAGGVHLEAMVAEVADAEGLDVRTDGLIDLKKADALAADGDPHLDALWTQSTDLLALTMANACTLLNPGVLLLGGGVLANLDDFRRRTLEKTTPLVLRACRDDLEIRFGTLGDDAGVLGAALLAAGS